MASQPPFDKQSERAISMYSKFVSIQENCPRGRFFVLDRDSEGWIFHLLGYVAMGNSSSNEWEIWDPNSEPVKREPFDIDEFNALVLEAMPLSMPHISAPMALEMLISGHLDPRLFGDSDMLYEEGPIVPSRGDSAFIFINRPKNTRQRVISYSGLLIAEPYDPDDSPLISSALRYARLRLN